MRVLIVSPYRTVAPHFENELEIAQQHLDRGDQVAFLSCLGELSVCDFNPEADRDTCHECRLRRMHGISQLEGQVRQHDFGGKTAKHNDSIPSQIPKKSFISVDHLTSTKINNFDVGYATLSSLVSLVRDPEIDLASYAREVKAFSEAALKVYRLLIDRLARNRPDRVYVFNGRFASMRAVLRACQLAGVECLIHERGCDTRHYQLFRNQLPHDFDYIKTRMRNHWNQAAIKSDRESKARAWFHDRVLRVEKNWHSFVKRQQRGRLPQGWNARLHNIVVFTSSEDEFVAIGDSTTNRIYEDQGEGVRALASTLKKTRSDAMLTVRMHPNQIGVDNARNQRLLNLDLPNVRIVPPEARIDSYQLMRVADTVATFGSSIGIESVFWSKPSVLLGPAFYQDLQGPWRAVDHQHALDLLADDLMPAARHEALLYGYWQNTHGIPFRYFEPDEGLFTGKFKGEVIYPKPVRTMGAILTKQLRSVRKRVRPSTDRRAA